jgi:hypothetical protein
VGRTYLGVLVDETTTKSRHLLAVQSLNFIEYTRSDLIASVFGEEDRDGAVVEHVDEHIVA